MTPRRYHVSVLAHNEAAVIADTLHAILSQQFEAGTVCDIHVFANGCTDDTEAIVREIGCREPRVHLVSVPEKGKVCALRHALSYFADLHAREASFDRLFFMDADVTFPESAVLAGLSHRLDESPDLYLVSAYPLVDFSHGRSGWYVSALFRTRQEVQRAFRTNIIRGACYVARWEALRQVDYPPDLLSDDMYLEVRINGHFAADYEHPVLTKFKTTTPAEIRRDLFTLIAREQVYAWYRKGTIPALAPDTARKEWELSYQRPLRVFAFLLKRLKLISLVVMLTWGYLHRKNERQAGEILAESRRRQINLLDYWSTQR